MLLNRTLLSAPIFLITPPFTQLNTPYPATAYLKGFFNTKGISAVQADLGIEVTIALFCKEGLENLFKSIEEKQLNKTAPLLLSENSARILALKEVYVKTIDQVISFLQGKSNTLAHLICTRNFLPEASRFEQLDNLNWAFGSMGKQDMAKHIATMYLEDLSDLIKENIDEHFGVISTHGYSIRHEGIRFKHLFEPLLSLPFVYPARFFTCKQPTHYFIEGCCFVPHVCHKEATIFKSRHVIDKRISRGVAQPCHASCQPSSDCITSKNSTDSRLP